MGDAPEIKVKLTAEDTGVSAAIKELTSQLKTLKKQQDETAGSGLSLAKAFESIAAAGAVLEIGKIGKEAFDSAVNIGKMGDKTGITTQTLSVFHKVAGDVGASTEAVDKGLLKAASTITQFEQGSAKAAAGFKILNLTQKDFAGLNTDQKLLLVTQRLGSLGAGFGKAEAQRQIFGRGASDLGLVLNSLAAQGFDKATEATSKLGLLLDQTTTDTFRAAKASMQELEDAGKGMATQFEAGLLPAISDVGEAILDSFDIGGKNGDGIREIGKVAGNVVRGIAEGFIWMGTVVAAEITATEELFSEQFGEIKTKGVSVYQALSLAVKGHFAEAKAAYDAGSRDIQRAQAELANKERAIWDTAAIDIRKSLENLFPSDAEEKRRAKERAGRLRPEKPTDAQDVTTAAPSDAAAKAALALLEKQLQDELAIHRAYAKQTEQVDKEMFDEGEISLAEYFDRRKTAITADAQEEVDFLKQGLAAAQAEVQKAAQAKATAATPKDADKQEAARLQALAKVDELQTKITETQINASTKIQALNTEEFKARDENQQKILEFHKTIDATQGKTLEAAKAEIAIEQQKLAIILRQSGESEAQVQAELARYAEVKTAQAEFALAEQKTQEDVLAFETQKKSIELEVKAGQITRQQGEKAINDLIAARLPLLQQDAQAETTAAVKTGDQANISKAQNAAEGVGNITTATNELQKQVTGDLTKDFESFFSNVTKGTETVGNAFRSLAASLFQSFAKLAEQQIFKQLFGDAGSGAGGGGGILSGGISALTHLFGFAEGGLVPMKFAEGGLIKGPGGPKSDSIPARVSPGEYIVKADAVSAVGVQYLESINRGMKIPSIQGLTLPKFAEGGLVGSAGSGSGGGDSNINLGIALEEGLVLKHLSSKAAGNIVLQHLVNNPKAAQKALSRSS
jgi:hypothetical protein